MAGLTPSEDTAQELKPSRTEKNSVIVVRSNDTDVFILLIHHAAHISPALGMDAGINSENTLRMMNIADLADRLTAPIM